MKTSAAILALILFLNGCGPKNLDPKKIVTQEEISKTSNNICDPGQTLQEVDYLSMNIETAFYSGDLFFFDKGNLKCAFEEQYSESPSPIPDYNRMYTSISFSGNCLENGQFYSRESASQYDGERLDLTLKPYADVPTNTNEVYISTSENKDLNVFHDTYGLVIYECK